MKRQHPTPYIEGSMSPYQQHRVRGGMNNYTGRADSVFSNVAEAEQHQHHHPHQYNPSSTKVGEAQWRQWDREAQNVPPNQMPPHAAAVFNEGQGGNGVRSYYQSQISDPKLGIENQASKESRIQPLEQDMEVGYEDNTLPLTLEGLERKFLDDVMKLVKEQSDAEDAENARHREKISEINTRYQEKLSTLRAQQANQREEFLHKEAQARLSQYQQAGMSHYSNTGLQDTLGYGGATVSGAAGEAHRAYSANQFDNYRERPIFGGGGRSQGAEGRVPYPEGRVYNNAGARYY